MNKNNIATTLREYMNEQKNIICKFLYHSTDIANAINILKDGEIKTYENKLKAANQDPLDWYDDPEYGKFVYVSDFQHNINNYYGLSDLDITFIIDSSKIKHKMIQADKSYEGGTISVQGNIPLKAVKKVIIYNSDDILINLLNSKNIEYSIKTKM